MSFLPNLVCACQVASLLLLLLVNATTQQSCGDHVTCEGDRPLLPSGCCPATSGTPCLPGIGEGCDTELGLVCEAEGGGVVEQGGGICQGAQNLRVTSLSQTEVTLEWRPFAPEDYMFEYLIYVREGRYSDDMAEWRRMECGNEPSYTVRRVGGQPLKPGTVYFFKVAFWEDPRSGRLGEASETLMVTTHAATQCLHEGAVYPVGRWFTHGCEDNCTCTAGGTFVCEPLCPEVEIGEGCRLVEAGGCCGEEVVCDHEGVSFSNFLPLPSAACESEGVAYPHGAEFERGCQQCACAHGRMECQWPPSCHVRRPEGACLHPVAVEREGECCPDWECESPSCTYENRTYSSGEHFTSAMCGLCQCRGNGGTQCAPDCPPVVMVTPDAACPDPHVRRDGCCETLHCWDPNQDLDLFVQNMFATAYSPATMTISFGVEPIAEEDGIAQYCLYEVLYANTSDPVYTWNRRVVQPIDARIHEDETHGEGEVIEALTSDSAIVVNDRAYVTIAGMYPNTTYYVKIRQLAVDAALQDNPSQQYTEDVITGPGRHIAAMVVVKTLPLHNATSCFHEGLEVRHGATVPSHCSLTCVCHMTRVLCESQCATSRYLIASSPSCPQPRLERTGEACCPVWRCYPDDNGCIYNDLLLTPGQAVTSQCSVCVCVNGSVTCQSSCSPPGRSPRDGCSLLEVEGQCCKQWSCPRESASPIGVESSIVLELQGDCGDSLEDFEERLRREVMEGVREGMRMVVGEEHMQGVIDGVNVEPHCETTRATPVTRRRREVEGGSHITVRVTFHSNWSSSDVPSASAHQLYNLSLTLAAILTPGNGGQGLRLEDHVTLNSARVQTLNYLCQPSFVYTDGRCERTSIEMPPTSLLNATLKASKVGPSTVDLTWTIERGDDQEVYLGYVIKFRPITDQAWLFTSDLEPSVRSHHLTSLTPGTEYEVSLVVKTYWTGAVDDVVATAMVKTSGVPGLEALSVVLGEKHVDLYWAAKRGSLTLGDMTLHLVCWSDAWDHVYDEYISQGEGHARIADLDPGTSYTVQLVARAQHGTGGHSEQKVTFQTLSNTGYTISPTTMIVVLASSGSLVMCLVVTLTCLKWRRSQTKADDTTGFVNQTYGIQIDSTPSKVSTPSTPAESHDTPPEVGVNPSSV